MQHKFRNPALELIERQERILRAYNNPALETRNYISNLHSQTDRIYEIERMAQKMCMPQAAINALDAYNMAISITTDRDFMGINKFAETLQKQLAAVREPMFQLAEINFSDWNFPALNDITSMVTSMNTALDPLIKSLSVYNTPAFTESLFSSAMAIDSALVNAFEHLHSIIEYFPDEAEQAFSENHLDMFSEELIFEEEKITFIEKIKEFLSNMTPYEKIKIIVSLIGILFSILSATNPSISAGYSNHTEKVIIGDTIQETSDKEFNFDLTFEDQNAPQNEELIACIEDLYQQLDTLTEMVNELEKQETSDCCQCDCCDNS